MCSFFRENYIKLIMITILLAAFCALTNETLQYQFRPVDMIAQDGRKAVSSARTTSSYRYSAQFNKVLNSTRYARFGSMYQPQLSTAIPGLSNTDVLGVNCNQMVPQGLCIAEDYMIVSAYDSGSNYGGRDKQRSVLYILSNKDPEKRTYLTTIVLPDINHVGGLAYDGRYVWIAKSTTKTCSAIDIKRIDHAVMSGQNSYEVDYTATVDCGMTASFLNYYDNRIWVGTFANKSRKEGKMASFEIHGSGHRLSLEKVNSVSIPYNANGVHIEKINDEVCMSIVSSFSRVSDTTVYLYELENDDNKEISKVYRGRYQFPPMGEEIASDGQNVYFLFESAATCYSEATGKKCTSPVDRICAVKMSDLYYWSDIALMNGTLPDQDIPEIAKESFESILPKDVFEMIEEIERVRGNITADEEPVIEKNSNIIAYDILNLKRIGNKRSRGPTLHAGRYCNGIVACCHIRAA